MTTSVKRSPKARKLRTLWDKGSTIDAAMHRLTVGDDYLVDCEFVRYDIAASAAHARMLGKIRILNSREVVVLRQGLRKILAEVDRGRFAIEPQHEDMHTELEVRLTAICGSVGKKIHTARSRNDQIVTAIRLYLRDAIITISEDVLNLLYEIDRRIQREGDLPLPGYTHFQQAMPSSVLLWLHVYAESLLELLDEGMSILARINKNPLGAAAGFGVPIPLDRGYVAKLLAFDGYLRSVCHTNNSRGITELSVVRWIEKIGGVLEKLSCDLMLYTMQELSFITLPKEISTGSSIMPQKRNPDIIELTRGKQAIVSGCAMELQALTAKLPSSYHRDFQLSKPPVLRAVKTISEMIAMSCITLGKMKFNQSRLTTGMSPELYATFDALREVLTGKPFREAYAATAEKVERKALDSAALSVDFITIARQAKRDYAKYQQDLRNTVKSIRRSKQRFAKALATV
jgi:argininosuccinate lyase